MKPITVDEVKAKINPILKANGVVHAGIFGSCARGEMHENSDIDILVEINKRISLISFLRLKNQLEDQLGYKVDLGEYKTIKPRIRESVLNETVSIL